MKDNHQSRKRRHAHEHESEHLESRKHHKHHNHHSTSPRHDRIRSPRISVEKRPPLVIRDQNELSADRDYVRNWLAHTQNEDIIESPKQFNAELDSGRPQKKSSYLGHDHTAHRPGEIRNITDPRPKLYEEHTSSDSFLLEASKMPVVDERSRIPQKPNGAIHGHVKERTRSHKHQRNVPSTITSISSGSSVMQPKQETFEKRARHKTREDRYDTKGKRDKAEAVDKPLRTRREKRGDRKKAAKKASEDLMSNFASNKIGQDRLTVRPSNGPGIFQNGRASSPPRRRGLPDLTFSEMEFLQRSGKKSHINDSIVVPKSRVKEKRKAVRAQDEIAEFFKPSKTPIRGNSSTIDHPTSPISTAEVSLYERQLGKDRETDRYRYYTEDLTARIGEKRSHLIESGSKQVQSNESQSPEKLTPKLHSEEISNRKVHYETVDTAVTWSESQNSPGATMDSRRAKEQYSQRQISATPDSIRNSIERTGIFKDTGIESSSRRKSNMQQPVNEELQGGGRKDIIYTVDSPVEMSREFSSLRKDSVINSHEIGRPPSFQQPDYLSQLPSHIQKRTEPFLKEKIPVEVDIRDDGLRRIVVEYYDPNRGWYRREESESPSRSPENPSKPTTALMTRPLTRQQIARNARIKRPSTTLPVIQEASDESRENPISSMSSISGKGIQRTESAPVRPSSGNGGRQRHTSPTNASERLDDNIREPRVSQQMFPPTNSQFQHDQQSQSNGRGESTNDMSRNSVSQTGISDEERKQPPEVRTANLNGRTFTPLRATSHKSPSRNYLQFSTQPPPWIEHESYHELSRQHFPSIPRSPLIRVPSLYVRQMELKQEEGQITNGAFNEKLEEYGSYKLQEPYFGVEAYEENWDLETELKTPYGVEDVLESRRYVDDLGELGPQEANVYRNSISRYEMAGLRYDNPNLHSKANEYQIQDVRGEEYSPWDSDNHFLQEPWTENRQDLH
ncbi:hypothetical protein BOTCAL_0433g00030 [Botryotinia calthae]|uniref:Uncharacterized protein n=1 Tax=Botryotinia calthae TaxID=38488 RepID=A0A4Y8CR20_9HELO|nr:hypothetical protein BOTCAL_0433g00030 [Botryotinia calthae]